MAALPLTVDTLQSASNEEEELATQSSPLMSPQCLKADSSNNLLTITAERPSNLTLDSSSSSPQHHQQHSNVTPSSSSSTLAHGNISPALSSAGSLSPSFLPEMPQWKRDLIQRRKQNVQRTISASSPTATAGAAASPTISLSSSYGGLKNSTSSSSVRSLAGSNTNIDQVASDGLHTSTKDYHKTLSSLQSSSLATTTTSSSLLTTTTIKVNKQHATETTLSAATTTAMPALAAATSPVKEISEKLFGGQYTATTTSSSSSLATTTSSSSTVITKEENKKIFTNQQQQQDMMENLQQENKEEEGQQWEQLKKTKEYNKEDDQHQEKEEEIDEITTTTTTAHKQQMATRLTGSTQTSSSSSSPSLLLNKREGEMKEREQWFSTTTTQQQQQHQQQQHHHQNITGAAIGILQNQSLYKCESERLVCTATTEKTVNNLNQNCGGTTTSGNNSVTGVVKISQKLQENQFIKNEQHLQHNIYNQNQTKKFIKFKNPNQNSQDLKSPTKLITSSFSSSSASLAAASGTASAAIPTPPIPSTNCAIKKKMVAVQEMKKSTQNTAATHLHAMNTTCNSQQQQHANRLNNRGGGVNTSPPSNTNTDLDNNEDLSYGPGIVSKLRYRYLSLALRESMEQQRFNKDKLRRSTSLNNLLDNNEEDEDEEDEEEEDEEEHCDEEEEENNKEEKNKDLQNNKENLDSNKKSGILKNSCQPSDKRFSPTVTGSNGVGVTFTETSFAKRSRHLKRGNDSLKRARSVEALLSEKSMWQTRSQNTTLPTCVIIEDKIHNARERLQQGTDHMPPKRLTSIIDDTERPPPDLVKQTLKMFEASANRRPRTTNRSNSKGDVASKVETFKNIIKEQKPVVSYPKPSSPTKKLQPQTPSTLKPLKTSTPQASDLLQSPLGRKALATANSSYNAANTECFNTPLKSNSNLNNSLSDHTPDIIPRQKLPTSERDFKPTKEIYSTNQINKEKYLNSLREQPLSNAEACDSPLISNLKKENKEKFEVDSPLTALTKELGKLKLSDNTTAHTKKNDNLKSDNYEINNGDKGGGLGGAGGNGVDNKFNKSVSGGGVGGDALFGHKNEETKEFSSSLFKNENDKQKQINNETIDETATNDDEATVNYNDSLATNAKASPPPSSSDLSDGGEEDDDDEYGGLKTKRITRSALDNIAKAGYTQQFKFNSGNSHTNSSSNSPTTTKQIGVIRPLLNTQQQQQQQKISSDMETLKHSSSSPAASALTSREIEKNRINDLKKSNTTSSSASPQTASLDHVIKSTSSSNTSSSPSPHSSNAASAHTTASASSGISDVDSVISATNSPLWAMRKRRQAPPSAPAENTTMVFNFSNRKEVPDYIENDGVIFRRKRELPKPNESGFVILGGDLSVETSTDFDCDDFSMCPPSPCDVEFENANIVIDGKSSIRQKPKDATFRVQFNDTLTSTFEYPSEASLIIDESFTAYNDVYTQPLGSDVDEFANAFHNLVLENCAGSSVDPLSSIHHHPIHHVADEIIQLPTIQANSPANTSSATPTKNILGNLPLDYPDLEKGIQLTVPTATTTTITLQKPQQPHEVITSEPPKLEIKRSRKDLKLPLGNLQQLQKPPLPVKRFQMKGLTANPLNLKHLPINSKDFQRENVAENVLDLEQQQQQQEDDDIKNCNILKEEIKSDLTSQQPQRKTPKVLNNPQYACFLQQPHQQMQQKFSKNPIQRSRSNEFQKSFRSMSLTTPVLRSNSLRDLESSHAITAHSQNSSFSGTTTTSLYFSSEVNSTDNIINHQYIEKAKNPAFIPEKSFNDNATDFPGPKSLSLHNLPQTGIGFFTENSSNIKSCSLNNLPETQENSLKSFVDADETCQTLTKSQELSNLSNRSSEYSVELSNDLLTKSVDNVCFPREVNYSAEYIVNNRNKFLKSDSKSLENLKLTENLLNFDGDLNLNMESQDLADDLSENIFKTKSKSVEDLKPTISDMTDDNSPRNSKSRSMDNFRSFKDEVSENYVEISDSFINQNTTEYSTQNIYSKSEPSMATYDYSESSQQSKSVDNINQTEDLKDLTNLTDFTDNSLKSITTMRTSIDNLTKYFVDMTENTLPLKSKSIDNLKTSNIFNKTTEYYKKSKSLDEFETLENSQDSCEYSVNITNSLSDENFEQILLDNEIDEQNLKQPKNMKELPSNSKFVNLNNALQMSIDSLDDYEDALEMKNLNELSENEVVNKTDSEINAKPKDSEALKVLEKKQDSQTIDKLSDSEALEILDDIAVGLNTDSILDFTNLLNLKKSPLKILGMGKSSNETDNNDIASQEAIIEISNCKEDISPKTNEFKEELKIHPKPPSKPLDLSSSSKKSKTLRVKTSDKIKNFTNMACQNVSTYSTFRKSQNFYRHASKSFKNSLKFYETLNEKRLQTFSTREAENYAGVKRSVSLTDTSSKKAEINRKLFSKSSKSRWSDSAESPTENSYSFEYYDALGDSNGNLVQCSLKENPLNLTNVSKDNKQDALNKDEVDFSFKLNLANETANKDKDIENNKGLIKNNVSGECFNEDSNFLNENMENIENSKLQPSDFATEIVAQFKNSSDCNKNFENISHDAANENIYDPKILPNTIWSTESIKNCSNFTNSSTENSFIPQINPNSTNLLEESTKINPNLTNLLKECTEIHPSLNNLLSQNDTKICSNLNDLSADNLKMNYNLSDSENITYSLTSTIKSTEINHNISYFSTESTLSSNIKPYLSEKRIKSELNDLSANNSVDLKKHPNSTNFSKESFSGTKINSNLTNLPAECSVNSHEKLYLSAEYDVERKIGPNLNNLSEYNIMKSNLSAETKINSNINNFSSDNGMKSNLIHSENNANCPNLAKMSIESNFGTRQESNLSNMSRVGAFNSNKKRNLSIENDVEIKINTNLNNLSADSKMMTNSENIPNFTNNTSQKSPLGSKQNSNLPTEFTFHSNKKLKLLPEHDNEPKFNPNLNNLSADNTANSKINPNLTHSENIANSSNRGSTFGTKMNLRSSNLPENYVPTNFNSNFNDLSTKINSNLSQLPAECSFDSKINANLTDLSAKNSSNYPVFQSLSTKNLIQTNFSPEKPFDPKKNLNHTNFAAKNTFDFQNPLNYKLTSENSVNNKPNLNNFSNSNYLKNPVNSNLKHNVKHVSESGIFSPGNFNLNPNIHNILPENAEDFNKNQPSDSSDKTVSLNLNLKPITADYFNTSPRPFRRQYEATTVVDLEEFTTLPNPQAVLNSPENISLTSPRPFRRVYEATTAVNWDEHSGNSTNNFELNKSFFNSSKLDNSSSNLVNSVAKPFQNPFEEGNTLSLLNIYENQRINSIKFPSDKNASFSLDSSLLASAPPSLSLDPSSLTPSSIQFSANSPTLSPKTFTNTKHLQLKPKLGFEPLPPIPTATLWAKDSSAPTSSTENKNNINNTSVYNKCTNFKTMVEVSKPNSRKTVITKSPSSFSSYSSSTSTTSTTSSTSSCRLSTKIKSTAKNQQHNRNATTTISSKSSIMPPKVLPRRLVAPTKTSFNAPTPQPIKITKTTTATSSSNSSTSSYNKASNSTTSNNTPLRRRIPGNTLYYV